MLSVIIIKFVGIGMGTLYWNTTGEVISWATARFGLFGVRAQVPHLAYLNYAGVLLTILSIVIFFFVKTQDTDTMNNDNNNDRLKSRTDLWLQSFSEKNRKVLGVFLAIFAGVMYGKLKQLFFSKKTLNSKLNCPK